jgi:hypothetical protein
MESLKQIEIPLSKSNIKMMFFGCIAFVGGGIWFVVNPPKTDNIIFGNQIVLFIVGLAAILFFGFIGFSLFKKLFDDNPGIIISDEGIYNNSGGFSAVFIPWANVKEIKETSVKNQLLINVMLKNPDQYIDSQKNIIIRRAIKLYNKKFGIIVSISSNGLICDHFELKKYLVDFFEEYRKQTNA